jgi:hypothetical protein
MAYIVDPQDPFRPGDNEQAGYAAAELRSLKGRAITLEAKTSALDAAVSASQLAQANAETAQNLSEQAQASSEVARDFSNKWATEAEDTPVDDGVNLVGYSSFHFKEKTEELYDAFRTSYYGALSSDPNVDPLGNPISTGDLYYNSTTSRLMYYTGSVWEESAFNKVAQTGDSGAAKMPAGTVAERPSVASVGLAYLRYNSEYSQWEGSPDGVTWSGLGGATGGAGNPAFYENDVTITQDYTITASKNAMTAGSVTIAEGVTVTVPDGSTWSIV